MLAFTRALAAGDEIYTMPFSPGASPSNLVHPGGSAYPSFSQSWLLSYWGYNSSGNTIGTILSDGSQQKTVLSQPNNQIGIPTISPNGTTIAYVQYVSGIAQINSISSNGGTPTVLYNQTNVATVPVVWSPSGTLIAFSAQPIAAANMHLFTMSSTGGSPTDITPSNYTSGNWIVSSWSPDGKYIACMFTPSGSSKSSIALTTPGNDYVSFISPSTFSDDWPSFAPDNTHIAFYRTNLGGAVPGIYETDLGGVNPQLLLADPAATGVTGAVNSISWSPYLEGQIFVGAHGTITASPVSGFLAAQNGSVFGSLLTFTATTPSTATLTQSGDK